MSAETKGTGSARPAALVAPPAQSNDVASKQESCCLCAALWCVLESVGSLFCLIGSFFVWLFSGSEVESEAYKKLAGFVLKKIRYH